MMTENFQMKINHQMRLGVSSIVCSKHLVENNSYFLPAQIIISKGKNLVKWKWFLFKGLFIMLSFLSRKILLDVISDGIMMTQCVSWYNTIIFKQTLPFSLEYSAIEWNSEDLTILMLTISDKNLREKEDYLDNK